MNPESEHFENLKRIIENIRTPEQLNDHPWTLSLLMQKALERDPSLAGRQPGHRLVLVIAELFREMQPSTPPLRGKRLDTRWGRFGILAANYFAPLLYGRLYPRSLRDAWRRIDPALLLFEYGQTAEELEPGQEETYRLIGNEVDMPANSTISDWHRGGLDELTNLFINREQHLSLECGEASPILGNESNLPSNTIAIEKRASQRFRLQRKVLLGIGALLLVVIVLMGVKARQVLTLVNTLEDDISALRGLDVQSLEPAAIEQVGPLLARTKNDLSALQAEVMPWQWLLSRLGWLPVYGGDLEHSADLLDMASAFLDSADVVYQTTLPVWQAIYSEEQDIKATELTGLFLETRPVLLEAQSYLDQAQAARERIDPNTLSPRSRKLVADVDPYLAMLDNALTFSLSLPSLLGGAEDGPKTYLILIQNEDELRPTGGFITSVGKVVVFQGELVSWSVEDSYAVDDDQIIYPRAPWQMNSFMNIPVFLFRDSNWYTNYPTTAMWAEYLYALTNSYSVDGVIAIDQHVLAKILTVTGPVYVKEIDTTVRAKDVRAIMRAQKIPPSTDERDPDWHRKQFLKPIAAAVLDRLLSGKSISWKSAISAVMAELDQHHILIQMDDPALTDLFAQRGWDGAVRNPGGDFLMLVDTNVGYNKTNAVMTSSIVYDVDLTDLSAPASTLTVLYKNNSQGQMGEFCDQRPELFDLSLIDYWYPIDRCYYNYLRVYIPAGTQLTDAAPHTITRQDMVMLDQDIPARVDLLNEKIDNVQGFGTLLVVPMGESISTNFEFNLPPAIFLPESESQEQTYRLRIQKQAGVESLVAIVRLHLPTGAEIHSIFPNGAIDGRNVLFELDSLEDIDLEVVFRR